MNRDEWKVLAQDSWINGPRAIEVAIFKGTGMVTAMTFEDRHNMPIITPTISAHEGREFLQSALDCAWAQGLRPTGFEHTHETVAAMDRHLQDMRAITFAKLNVEKPNG